MKEQKKLTAKGKPLVDYVQKIDEKMVTKTIRGPEPLWKRAQALADRYEVSLNQIVLLAIEKACDEEKV